MKDRNVRASLYIAVRCSRSLILEWGTVRSVRRSVWVRSPNKAWVGLWLLVAAGPGGLAQNGTPVIPGIPYQAKVNSGRPTTADTLSVTGPIVFLQHCRRKPKLTSPKHTAGTPEKKFILEAKGPGVALLDYDNDGWMDIYFVNGSTV